MPQVMRHADVALTELNLVVQRPHGPLLVCRHPTENSGPAADQTKARSTPYFLAGAFFTAAFLAGATFLAAAFFTTAFFAGAAFLAGAFFTAAIFFAGAAFFAATFEAAFEGDADLAEAFFEARAMGVLQCRRRIAVSFDI